MLGHSRHSGPTYFLNHELKRKTHQSRCSACLERSDQLATWPTFLQGNNWLEPSSDRPLREDGILLTSSHNSCFRDSEAECLLACTCYRFSYSRRILLCVWVSIKSKDNCVAAFSLWTEEDSCVLVIPNSHGRNKSWGQRQRKVLARKLSGSFSGQMGLVGRGRILSFEVEEMPL